MKLALACLLASAAAAETSPLSAIDAAWRAKGFSIKDRISISSGDLSAHAVVYSPVTRGADRLEVYVVAKNKAYLGFTHPSTVERIELDSSPTGRFEDMFQDGSLALAYHANRVSLGATELNVLRWKRFKIERVAVFHEGRFLILNGKTVVAARELPLGRYLSIGCVDFGAISQTAFKTVLSAPRDGGFMDVSSEHPEYYESEIVRKEKELARLKGELKKNAGEYLGLALSTYYDYAALGRARRGWTRLSEILRSPPLAPPTVKTCMSTMGENLRGKLQVPTDWP